MKTAIELNLRFSEVYLKFFNYSGNDIFPQIYLTRVAQDNSADTNKYEFLINTSIFFALLNYVKR